MLDHCTIIPSRLQPGVDLKDEEAIRALFPDDFPVVVTGGAIQRPNLYRLSLGFGAKRNYPIRIHFHEGEGRQVADRIEVNFTVLLWGHNGRVLSEDEFHQGCLIYLEISKRLFTSNTYLYSLPGLLRNCTSYWGSVEWFAQGADPERRMIEAFQYAEHPRAKKVFNAGAVTQDNPAFAESRKLRGANLTIKLYSKSRESRGYTAGEREAFRFEVTVRYEELKRHLDYDLNEEEEPRLRTFTFKKAYDVLKAIALEMESPTETKAIQASKGGHGDGLAQIALDLEASPERVARSYYSACKGSCRTVTRIVNTVKRMVSIAKVFPWREKLAEFNNEPLHVTHDDFEETSASVNRIYLEAGNDLPAIKQAYSETRFCNDDDCSREIAPWA
jgi:hypothetical protein